MASLADLWDRMQAALPFSGAAEYEAALDELFLNFDGGSEMAWIRQTIRSAVSREQWCIHCDGILRLRRGSRGRFFGCSNYPRCAYTRSVG